MSFLALTADPKILPHNDNDKKLIPVEDNETPSIDSSFGKVTTTTTTKLQAHLLKGGGGGNGNGKDKKKILEEPGGGGGEQRRDLPARRSSHHYDQRPSTERTDGTGGGGIGGGGGRRRRSSTTNSNACHTKMTLSVNNGNNSNSNPSTATNNRSRSKGGRANHNNNGNPRWSGKQSSKPFHPQHHTHYHPPRHSRNNHDHHFDDALWDDEGLDSSLELWLQRRGAFDPPEGLIKRQSVLTSLETIVGDWSDSLRLDTRQQQQQLEDSNRNSQAQTSTGSEGARLLRHTSTSFTTEDGDDNDSTAIVARATLVCFGSYRLGVQRPDADIDLLLLAPRHCSRADFFRSLVARLSSVDSVSEIHPIPSAYTPVLKFRFDGIAVDLLFASLSNETKLLAATKRSLMESVESPRMNTASAVPASLASLPTDIQLADEDLLGLDEASVRSINGVRIAQMLLAHVPDVDAYRLCLRAVKEWAIVNGLYSNVLGFLGGVNFAIMVAWVCRRHPNMTVTGLLRAFFNRFANWRWPTAVKLGSLAIEPPAGAPYMQAWNPKANPRDGAHVMPIITPVYPCMNSAYNVGFPHCRRIQHELRRADAIVSAIGRGQRGWGDLFASSNFFRENFHFLQVDTSAATVEDFTSWFGFVESRLRILIVSLDAADMGVHSIPFAKFFRRKPSETGDAPKNEHMTTFFIGLRFASSCEQVDLQSCMGEFLYKVNSWEERRPGMDLRIKHVLRSDLPNFVFEEDDRRDETKIKETAKMLDKDETTSASCSVMTKNGDAPTVTIGEVPPNPSPLKRARRKSPEANHHLNNNHSTTIMTANKTAIATTAPC